MKQTSFLKINPADSVVVCLRPMQKGETITIDGKDIEVKQDTPAGHKLLIKNAPKGTNIIKYGYENKGGELFIRLLYNIDQKEFVLTVIDRAPAFNQLEVNNSIVNEDIDKQKTGGLGILIVKKIMTEYAYDRINGKNILVLRKKF